MLQVMYCFVNNYEVNIKFSLSDNTIYFLQELKSVSNGMLECLYDANNILRCQ